MTTRTMALSSWQASVRGLVERPVRASLVGAALTSARGDARKAVELLHDSIACLREIIEEEESKSAIRKAVG